MLTIRNCEKDCETSGYCTGFKHCHESKKTYSKDDPECQECLQDAKDAIKWSMSHMLF